MWGSVVLGVKQAISSNTNAAEMFETGSSAPDRGFLGWHSLTKKRRRRAIVEMRI
jgi:hypothetical protein